MEKIIKTISSAATVGEGNDDAFTDRLNSRYTVVILMASAFLVSASLYVGKPIQCWSPKHMTGNHNAYMNNYCWVRNTYYLPWAEQFPDSSTPLHEKRMVPYYQWIPFILLGQALMFYLPKLIWNGLNQKVGVDSDDALEVAHKLTTCETLEKKHNLLKLISNQVHRVLGSGKAGRYYAGWQCNAKHLFVKICSPFGTGHGNYLTLLYLFHKLLYILNLFTQIFMLNKILSTAFNVYGFDTIAHWIEGDNLDSDWTKSPDVAFPRVTFCDFDIRRMGNVHRYTVQCVLPINMYNEKIYMFLWFWFVFVLTASIIDFLTWFFRACLFSDRVKFISNHLNFLRDEDGSINKKDKVEIFVGDYLKQDGCFLLRLISHNTNNMTTTDVTNALWNKWQEWQSENPEDADSEGNSSDMDKSRLYPSIDDVDNKPVVPYEDSSV